MKNLVRLSLCALAVSVFGGITVDAQNITTVAGGGPPASGVAKTGASVGAPSAVRQDSLGNTYILDNDFGRVYKVDTAGKLTVFAGSGTVGFSGEAGPATDAAMFNPTGMCIDALNNVYVADSDNGIIREIVVTAATGKTVGHIYTVAGTESEVNFQYGGDGGPATSASLQFPDGCSFDSSGNLYIADKGNNAIRVVIGTLGHVPAGLPLADNVPGNIYLFAGSTGAVPPASPVGGYGTNNTPALGAALNGPYDVFVDSHDNVFIADFGNPHTTSNQVVREVAGPTPSAGMTTGNIYTVAGTPMTTGPATNGVSALAATLNGPQGLFVDTAGNLFFADNGNHVIREVAGPAPSTGMTAGNIYTIAGTGASGGGGNGGLAISATLTLPKGTFVVSVASAAPVGTILIADSLTDFVRAVSSNTGNYTTETINTFAGDGLTSFSNATPATAGQLNVVAGIAVDPAGNLAINDIGVPSDDESVIRGVAAPIATGALTVLAGRTQFNGFSNTAPFGVNNPLGVAYDASGNLYIADTGNCIIRKLSAGVMTTVAGFEPTLDLVNPPASTPNCGSDAPGSPAVGTKLGAVNSVALDAAGDIFFSDATNNVIWEVPKTTVGTMTAGDAYIVVGTEGLTGSFGGDGGLATAAHLKKPTGITFDVYGNLFIADTGNNVVREVPADNTGAVNSGFIYTVAGDNVHQAAGYTGEGGVAVGAEMNTPFAVAVDHAGNIFIADTNNHIIREVAGPTPSGGQTTGHIYRVAGTAQTAGFSGDGGAAKSADLNFPEGLALDGAGDLLIGDSVNLRVRSVAAIANEAAVPTANFNKSVLTFTGQPVNIASTPQTVTLTNNGTAALTGIAITLGGADAADFSLVPAGTCTAPLPAGQSCTISVTFTPTAVRTFNANVSIADNAVGTPQTITLTGTGQLGSPVDVITPNPLAFTPQQVGVASAALPVTVSNATGTGPLVITGITLGGTNGSDFSQTNTCGALPASVAVGATCTINVVFNPTSATPAARTATLTLADNAADSPVSINITGMATAATVSFSPATLAFGSQAAGTTSAPLAITVTNTGSAALAFTGIAIAGPNKADFSLAPAATCTTTTTVPPAKTCTISVTYAPAAADTPGPSTAMVIVGDNATGLSQTINLTGTVTAAALALNLGAAAGGSTTATVTAGQTATYSLQISANQNASVTFTCSGAPTAATCAVPTTAVTVTAGTPAAVSVTVSTTARGLLVPQSEPTTRIQPPAAIQMLPLSALAVILLMVTLLAATQSPAGRLRVARVALSACLVLMPIMAATLLGGCGGGGSSTTPPPPVTGTPAGTYTITVNATSGSTTAKTQLTLIVQ
jgi:sugar lactone lactonase YvrE